MSNPKYYTAKDIERYHNGGMTAAEMHQLERAALNDPMLADALEGYRFSKSPASEISSLQSRLQQRLKAERKESRTLWMQPWMRIVALAVLIAGAGWLVFQTFSNNENNLASSSPAAKQEEKQYESLTADSIATALEQSPAALSIDSNTRDVASQNTIRSRRTQPAVQAETSAPLTVMRDASAVEKNETVTKSEEADAAIAHPQNDVATMKTAAPAAVPRQQMDSNVNTQVAKRRRANVQEQAAATESRAGVFAADSLGQPETGWTAFEEYIAKNRKPFLPLNKKQTEESSVELAFAINQQGRPINIVVTQSLNKEYNEEAIRLLKEGPKWKGKAGRVKILF
ncbi:MAG TPA: hypothetical protein VGN63_10235 [Flavisolibacter sp.]|jgi:cytoskeletal protein RodZ|nr:hypothetical protein [Flavisolibacter sp.]